MIQQNRKRTLIGTPNQIKEQLFELKAYYKTDEFMIITNIFDFEAKKRSYQLLAKAIL